jgi:hypothetical protein
LQFGIQLELTGGPSPVSANNLREVVQMRTKRIDVIVVLLAVLVTVVLAIARTVKLRTAASGGPARTGAKRGRRGKGFLRRKRVQVALALAALAAVASASVGVTLALYSNKPTGETNTFVAGTVSVSNVVTGACSASTNNMAPADTASCTLATTYGGTLSGYMGLDVFIATQKNTTAGGGSATNLYNPADTTNEAQITVSSTTPTVTYIAAATNFGTAITCPAALASLDGNSYTSYNACYQLSNLLVASTAFASGTVTFTTGITLPSTQPNTYQGSSAVVVLAAHVVQSKNNTLNCTGGATAGVVCAAGTGFSWS